MQCDMIDMVEIQHELPGLKRRGISLLNYVFTRY